MSEEIKLTKKELKAQRKEAKRLEKERRRHLTVSENCKGCGAYMSLDQRFCNECGAQRMYNRLNWGVLFQDFTDRFLNIENNFLRTFIDLFARPQEVIDGYINGVRKKHLSAFSYFAIAVTIAGISAFIIKTWFMDEMIATQTSFFDGSSQAEFQKEFQKDWFNIVMDYQSVFYFLAIPFMAVISWIVFWNYKKYNFVEQIVIYLYGYSQIAIATVVLGLLIIWSQTIYQVYSFAILIIRTVYLGYVLKKLYELDWGGIILKTALFLLVIGVIFFALTVMTTIVFAILGATGALEGSHFFEMIQQQAEIEKAALLAKDSLQQVDSLKQLKEVVLDTIK